ncbi:MAG TPA: hypothetical protein VFI95_04350 [Terriglobales bacterium]|nr:hypothetical protein [Terriglobales bacterium]
MPPKGVKSPKRKRQYEHIKQSYKKRGQSGRAEEIAARTVNKQRRESGQTKSSSKKKSSSRKSSSKRGSSRKKSGSRRK